MHSIRASMQSVTAKRLSTEQQQQSILSSAQALANKSLNIGNMSTIVNNAVTTTTSTSMQISTTGQQQQLKNTSSIGNETFATTTTALTNNSLKTLTSAIAKKSLLNTISNTKQQQQTTNENYVQMSNYEMLSFDSLDSYDNYATAMRTTTAANKKSFEHKLLSNVSNDSTIELNDDECIEEDDEVPPALPIKTRTRLTRRDRHLSQYDNVEETDEFSK